VRENIAEIGHASVSELPFWHKDRLLDVHTIKNSDLKGLLF
jgi:hypothetical protein